MNLRVPEDPRARLRARLRAGDPLESGEEEVALARIESRLDTTVAASSASGSRAEGLGWRFVAPAFGLLTIVAVAWLGVRFASPPSSAESERPTVAPDESSTGESSTGESSTAGLATPGAGETRQIQFETPGGTRVVWVLDPRFTL